MTITLPDDVRAQAERQAAAAGFASVADYLADLVREDGETEQPVDQYAGRTREQLEALLNETLGCEWKVMDEAFWQERRRKMLEYAAKRGVTS
jgi:Arc/MetJ-type ribon-helix-helix transcriptional regulator